MTLARRAALCLVVLLAACKAPEKPVFEAFDFYYLTKIKLNVATIEIDDGWVPRGSAVRGSVPPSFAYASRASSMRSTRARWRSVISFAPRGFVHIS